MGLKMATIFSVIKSHKNTVINHFPATTLFSHRGIRDMITVAAARRTVTLLVRGLENSIH